MKLKVLIVDDEPLARGRMRDLLAGESDLEIIGEAGDGRQAVDSIQQLAPDIVFLDVQMPELDGFEVVAALSGERMPAVIFVTAFDQFAVKAFEVHAVDYLLKPFDGDRLRAAIQRAKDRLLRGQTGNVSARLESLVAGMKSEGEAASRLVIKTDGKMVIVRFAEIDWLEAADNYVLVHVGKERHMQRGTLGAMEEKLPAATFVRISRSAIVNVDRIKELQPLFHGEYAVLLRTGTRLTLTRTYRESLERLGMI